MYSIPLNYLCFLCVSVMGRQSGVEVPFADLRFVYGNGTPVAWIAGFYRLALRGTGCSAQCHSDGPCMVFTT